MDSVNRDCPKYRECLVNKVKDLKEPGKATVGDIDKWLDELSKACDKSCGNIDDELAQLERMSTAELFAEANRSSINLEVDPELEAEFAKLGSLKKRKKSKRKKKSKSSKKSKKSTKTKKSKTKSKKSKRVKRTKRVKRSRTKRVKRN